MPQRRCLTRPGKIVRLGKSGGNRLRGSQRGRLCLMRNRFDCLSGLDLATLHENLGLRIGHNDARRLGPQLAGR